MVSNDEPSKGDGSKGGFLEHQASIAVVTIIIIITIIIITIIIILKGIEQMLNRPRRRTLGD